jgi:Mediator complex subunit 13 N-terminal
VGSHGVFKSSELASNAFSRRITAAHSTDGIQSKTSDSLDDVSLPELYHHFISAFNDTATFTLVSQTKVIPLYPNAFAVCANRDESANYLEPPTPVNGVQFTTYLTSAGVIVFSLSSLDILDYLHLSRLPQDTYLHDGVPTVIVPGLVPTIRCTMSRDFFDSERSSRWRRNVVVWLTRRGLTFSRPDDLQSWVAMRLPQRRGMISNSGSDSLVILWPLSLCFHCPGSSLEPQPHASGQVDSSAALWFKGPEDAGFTDMLNLAEQWIESQPEKQLAARRARQKEVNNATSVQVPASPVHMRNITYGESHGLAGVYPTPPDGLSSQVGTVALSMDTPIGLPYDLSSQSIDLKAISNEAEGDRNIHITGRPITQDNVPSKMDDDLFDDMDEDDFVGNDITDADFSFFDQPDDVGSTSNDVDMKMDFDEADKSIENSKPRTPDDNMEDMQIEPVALSERQENDQQAGPGSIQDIEMLDSDKMIANVTANENENSAEKSVFLTPAEVRRRLFLQQSPEHLPSNPANNSRKHSEYEPLPFSHRLISTDAKYSSLGSLIGTQSSRKGNVELKTRISLPKTSTEFDATAPAWLRNADQDMDDSDSGATEDSSGDSVGEQAEFTRRKSVKSDNISIHTANIDDITTPEVSQESGETTSENLVCW